MNCAQVIERLVDLFDAEPDAQLRAHVETHVAECEDCARLYRDLREALATIEPHVRLAASPGLEETIMSNIASATPAAAPTLRRRFSPVWVAAAVAVAVAGVLLSLWSTSTPPNKAYAAAMQVMQQGSAAVEGLKSVYIKMQMRTRPVENFDHIGLDDGFVDIELWKEFSPVERWRIEKPERVVVMDGERSTLWIPSLKLFAEGGPQAGFVVWLRPLLDVEGLLEHETALAQTEGSSLLLEKARNADGTEELVVKVEAAAQGDYSQSDYSLNSSITESDNLRIYRFDAQSKRLVGMQVFVHGPKGDVEVFHVDEIRYDEPLDPALFALDIPADAIRHGEPQVPAGLPADNTPEGLARAFFDACAAGDWDAAGQCWAQTRLEQVLIDLLDGMELVSLGKPFKSGLYPGVFVPYQIRLKSGQIKKGNLAVRNDNAAKQYYCSGGI